MAGHDPASGARCAACGYANRADAHLCNLCGEYLYAAVAAERERASGPRAAPAPPAPRADPTPEPEPEPSAPEAADPDATSAPLPQAAPRRAIALGEPDASNAPLAPAERPARAERSVQAEPSKPPAAHATPPAVHAAPPAVRAAPSRAAEPERLAPDADAAAIEGMLRLRARWVAHGWAGVALVLGLATLAGLPGSLHPITLVLNGVAALCFGFPLGYAASRLRCDAPRGALLGVVFGLLFSLPRLAVLVSAGGLAAAWAPLEIAVGMAAGIIPGALIGYHVKHDT